MEVVEDKEDIRVKLGREQRADICGWVAVVARCDTGLNVDRLAILRSLITSPSDRLL